MKLCLLLRLFLPARWRFFLVVVPVPSVFCGTYAPDDDVPWACDTDWDWADEEPTPAAAAYDILLLLLARRGAAIDSGPAILDKSVGRGSISRAGAKRNITCRNLHGNEIKTSISQADDEA